MIIGRFAENPVSGLLVGHIRTLFFKSDKVVMEPLADGGLKAPSHHSMMRGGACGAYPPFLAPVFKSVLTSPATQKKKHLTQLDAASDKPEKLYLQVFDYETGGHGSTAGYQVQLPVGCLTAYFGVGPNEARDVIVEMMGATLSVSLTHFANNTHRIRLKPLLDIVRPAIIVFERSGEDHYVCAPVPAKDYMKTLALKCTEQQRDAARRWGIE